VYYHIHGRAKVSQARRDRTVLPSCVGMFCIHIFLYPCYKNMPYSLEFVAVLRIRIRISKFFCLLYTDPDLLVRVMDPWIQIRIHPKMSWIRKSEKLIVCEFFLINDVAADSGFVSVADSGLNSLHPSPPVHDPNLKYF
jgi:hypothetical protein